MLTCNPAIERRNGTAHSVFATIGPHPAGVVGEPLGRRAALRSPGLLGPSMARDLDRRRLDRHHAGPSVQIGIEGLAPTDRFYRPGESHRPAQGVQLAIMAAASRGLTDHRDRAREPALAQRD